MAPVKHGRLHLQPFRRLIIHAVSGALVCVILFSVEWLVSLCLDYLNGIHRFPPQVYTLIGRAEIWLFYFDCALSVFAFAISIIIFVTHILEGG